VKLTERNIPRYNPAEEEDHDDNVNFKEILLKHLRHWPYYLASISITIIIAFLVNQYTPPKYKIASEFLIKEDNSAINLFEYAAGSEGILPKGQKIANETLILRSRTIAEEVLNRLSYDIEYYEEGIFTNREIYKDPPATVEVDWDHSQLTNGQFKISWKDDKSYELEFLDGEYNLLVPGKEKKIVVEKPVLTRSRFSFGNWVLTPFMKFKIDFMGPETSGTLIIKFQDWESLVTDYTGDKLQIALADKASSILTLTLEARQPQKARDYLNTLMNVFLDNELDEKNTIVRSTISFIDRELTGISDSLRYAEKKLEKYRTSHRTYDITTEGNTIFEKLSELEKLLSEENFKKEYYQNLQDYIVKEEYSEIIVPSGLGINDPVLNKLIEDLVRLQSEQARLTATQTQDSPAVLEVRRNIAELTKSIKEVLRNVNYNSGLIVKDLEKRIAKIERQFGRLPQTEQDLLNIKRAYSFNENIYTFLLQRRTESAITLASNKATNKIIEPAVLTFMPMRLIPLMNYFLAILLGLMIPAGVIFGRDFFAVKINEVNEIERKLKVPLLGSIGQNTSKKPLVVLSEPNTSISEAFRALRTDVHFIFPKDKAVTIMLTSTISGEGKTFCAANLASVYSVSGKKTILIGCDMHKPYSFEDFEVSNTVGLSSYLSVQVNDVHPLIQKTRFQNLDLLVPGPLPPNPAELLISDRFEQMMLDLKKRYDVIVLDTSPVGLTNESFYLTRIADLTIYLLRQNYSNKSYVDFINSLKEKKGIKSLYVVINDVKDKYLSHGGYGYGYYDGDDKKSFSLKKLFKKRKSEIKLSV